MQFTLQVYPILNKNIYLICRNEFIYWLYMHEGFDPPMSKYVAYGLYTLLPNDLPNYVSIFIEIDIINISIQIGSYMPIYRNLFVSLTN